MQKSASDKSEIARRSFIFSVEILNFIKSLPFTVINTILIKQLIRAATSIGANIEEALGAHTKNDFTYSMNVAKKEARETYYWLRLLATQLSKFNKEKINILLDENLQIVNILSAIVKTSLKR